MNMNHLDKRVLKLWYLRASINVAALVAVLAVTVGVLLAAEASGGVLLGVLLGVGIPVLLLLALVLILPALRYKMYAWGYDDKRIIVHEGVIFRHRVVLPICQIQDLHRSEGPLMMLLGISCVTVSTAGSNFNISTLTTDEAQRLIVALEAALEARVEGQKNETL